MKLKIAALTSTVLFIILVVLESFIYFAVDSRVTRVHQELLANVAQSVALEYAGHAGEGGDGSSPAWLKQHVQLGQEVLILDTRGNLLLEYGNLNTKSVRAQFRPTDRLKQSSIGVSAQTHWLLTILPVHAEVGHRLLGYVMLAADDWTLRDFMGSLLAVLIVGGMGAVLFAGLGGYLVAAAGLRPIQHLITVMMRTGADRLDERVPVHGRNDEIARLANQFNVMLSRIERSFEQQRQFVADASHEIRTPLTTILGYSSLLKRWGKTDPKVLNQSIDVIQKEAGRLQKLADDLLTLAGLDSEAHDRENAFCRVDEVVDEVVETTRPIYPTHRVHTDFQSNVEVNMSSHHLRTVVSNILTNAVKYTEEGGEIRVSTWADAETAFIEIADTGCGIPSSDLPYVFDRFYRVDKSRDRSQGGNGIGLAIVREILRLCGGDIQIQSQINAGTTVKLALRVHDGVVDGRTPTDR